MNADGFEQKAVHQARSQDKSTMVLYRVVTPGSMIESPTIEGLATRSTRKEEDSEDDMLVSSTSRSKAF